MRISSPKTKEQHRVAAATGITTINQTITCIFSDDDEDNEKQNACTGFFFNLTHADIPLNVRKCFR